jgi:predicted ATP-dependent serine protease
VSFFSNVAPKRRMRVAVEWVCTRCRSKNRKIMGTCEACGAKRPKREADLRA